MSFSSAAAAARTPRTLVLEVLDGEPNRPTFRDLDPRAVNGRGLHLLAAVTAQWGVRPTGTGKAVWCELSLTEAASPAP